MTIIFGDCLIELNEEYSEIARKRVEYVKSKDIQYDIFEDKKVNYVSRTA